MDYFDRSYLYQIFLDIVGCIIGDSNHNLSEKLLWNFIIKVNINIKKKKKYNIAYILFIQIIVISAFEFFEF